MFRTLGIKKTSSLPLDLQKNSRDFTKIWIRATIGKSVLKRILQTLEPIRQDINTQIQYVKNTKYYSMDH